MVLEDLRGECGGRVIEGKTRKGRVLKAVTLQSFGTVCMFASSASRTMKGHGKMGDCGSFWDEEWDVRVVTRVEGLLLYY